MTTDYFTTEIADVQAQLGRADTKGSILTGLSLAALTGGAAILAKVHLHGFAVAGAVLAACLIGAALVLLGLAIRPALGGNHGFVRWATPPTATALRRALRESGTSYEERVEALWVLARSAQRKYQRIRAAVDLLGAALAATAITAAFVGVGW
ncbi:Pycsar system effector family protein [Actinoplanes sp. NPDC049265]|uniref:Pycsar system effector family protein n=1 Tax=Actinoplanes sp. NPDC049265 TaxID=3363902 RepID=UPI00371DFF2E